MDFFNYALMILGLFSIVQGMLRKEPTHFSKKHFISLEKRYGKINISKTIQLEASYSIFQGVFLLGVGILMENINISIKKVLTLILGINMVYYTLRGRYICEETYN